MKISFINPNPNIRKKIYLFNKRKEREEKNAKLQNIKQMIKAIETVDIFI